MMDKVGTVFLKYDPDDARDLARRLNEAAKTVQQKGYFRLVRVGVLPDGRPLSIEVQPTIEGRTL